MHDAKATTATHHASCPKRDTGLLLSEDVECPFDVSSMESQIEPNQTQTASSVAFCSSFLSPLSSCFPPPPPPFLLSAWTLQAPRILRRRTTSSMSLKYTFVPCVTRILQSSFAYSDACRFELLRCRSPLGLDHQFA